MSEGVSWWEGVWDALDILGPRPKFACLRQVQYFNHQYVFSNRCCFFILDTLRRVGFPHGVRMANGVAQDPVRFERSLGRVHPHAKRKT